MREGMAHVIVEHPWRAMARKDRKRPVGGFAGAPRDAAEVAGAWRLEGSKREASAVAAVFGATSCQLIDGLSVLTLQRLSHLDRPDTVHRNRAPCLVTPIRLKSREPVSPDPYLRILATTR
jgi:hypothetical protein